MTKFAQVLILTALLLQSARAATVTTIAGAGAKGFSGDGGLATEARLDNPYGIARGPDGLIYICDSGNHRVRRILADGTIETYAGSGQRGYKGDGGPATAASLDSPYEMAWDHDGNLFFAEQGNHTVRRVDAKTHVITTAAGTGKAGFSGDGGPAPKARLNNPDCLAFDPAGDLFICDIANFRIRKIDMKTGTISTWSGTGAKSTAPDGSPIAGSPLNGPRALAFSPDGKCWVALREGNALLELDAQAGTLKRAAGTGKTGFTGNDGPALSATLAGPKCVAVDAAGNVYLADTESHSIRRVDAKDGTIQVIVGTGKKGDGPDGDPLACQLNRPHGVFIDKDGSILLGDSENHRVRVWRK